MIKKEMESRSERGTTRPGANRADRAMGGLSMGSPGTPRLETSNETILAGSESALPVDHARAVDHDLVRIG